MLSRLESRLRGAEEDLHHQLTGAVRDREPADVSHESNADRPSRVAPYLLLIAVLAVGAYTTYVYWRLSAATEDARTRAIAAERQAVQAGQLADREKRAADEALQRVTAGALASAAKTERVVNVLTATDLRRFVLVGQPAAPTAVGQALWSRSRGLVLTVSRLAAAPSDQVHQVWLVTSRGTLSLGVVTPDAQGRVSGTFDLPSDLPGTVLGVMLTLERSGGSATPSGPVLIAS
jgi:hypothetical protein